jgi:leader peptidase (prepilin peptidase)/N-methyltransferase
MLEQQWSQDVALWLAEQESGPSPGGVAGGVANAAPYNLARPGSHCPACGHALAWRDNIPLLSYLLLRGRCRSCRSPIGWRYPVVELLTAALFAACAWRWGLGASALVWAAFAATLLALACIDADTQLLPDALTLPLLWGGLISAAAGWSQTAVTDALWGAVAGYGVLWLLQQGFGLATGKQGIGQGDFKLLAALGAWLGWQALLPLLLLASLGGAAIGLGLRWSGRLGAGQPLAFGPYLAMAGAALMWLAPLDGLWP